VTAPGWLDELPLAPGPPWHAMGTRALPVASASTDTGDDVPGQLAAKRDLLVRRRDVVSVRLDEAATVVDRPSPARATVPPAAGAPWTALETAAMSVAEDLCLLVEREVGWRLDSGVVCFPSLWRLADKIGRPLAEVHGPVPAYAAELADRVDRLVARLQPDRPVWRRNWFVHHDPALHQPAPRPAPDPMPAPPVGLWLRSERQTLRRLPDTGAVLFTIRTQQVPLSALSERPDLAVAMAAAIDGWSPELVAYKGVHGALLALPWLRGGAVRRL
jgi:dimethylamine monooxygenase subunit A